jgi:hypothetical protein
MIVRRWNFVKNSVDEDFEYNRYITTPLATGFADVQALQALYGLGFGYSR